jgi:glycosyltransferase involved in cell wall biosynthesis
MKIIYIVSSLERTGPINFLFNLIIKLHESNEITILTLSEETNNSMFDSFSNLNLSIINVSSKSTKFNFFYLKKKVFNIVNLINPDLIHSNGLRPDLITYTLFLKGYKCISTLHNFPFEDYPKLYGFLIGNIAAFFHIYILKKFKSLVACSEYIKKKFFQLGFRNCIVIRNGIDTDLFHLLSKIDKINIRKKLNLPYDKHIITFVGPLIKRKRIVDVIKVFNNLLQGTKYLFVILGEGVLRKKIMKLIKGNNIVYLGFKNNVHEYLKASDFYISYSSSEGLPIGAIEALSTGNYLFLSNIGPHQELFNLYKNQVEILNKSIDGEKILETLNFITLNGLKIKKSYTKISNSTMAKNYSEFYKEIVNE